MNKAKTYFWSAWPLIQPKEYLPTVPCPTHTSMTWRDARRTRIPTCHPARTAPRWTQPEGPATALSWSPREHRRWLMAPPEEALHLCWGPQAGDLLAARRLLDGLCFSPPSLLCESNARANAALCSFIDLFVCLFVLRTWKNSRRRKEAADQLCCHFHLSNFECCQCKVSNPGTAELWCNLSAAAGA